MEIGTRITYLRKEKGITVNKLATISGVSQSFLRDVERGRKKPSVAILTLVCEALGITVRDFFDDGTPSIKADGILMQELYRLTPEQKECLGNLLHTFNSQ